MNIYYILFYLFTFKKYNIKSGNDERIINNNNTITTQKIYEMMNKKKLLDYLQSHEISMFDKLNRINENNVVKVNNITNGGLLDHWNFDI